MASLSRLVSAIFVMIIFSAIDNPVGAVKEIKVGGIEGWRQPGVNHSAMFNQWAAVHRFHVGDSLREFSQIHYLFVNYAGFLN